MFQDICHSFALPGNGYTLVYILFRIKIEGYRPILHQRLLPQVSMFSLTAVSMLKQSQNLH